MADPIPTPWSDDSSYTSLLGPNEVGKLVSQVCEESRGALIPVTRWSEGARSLAIRTLLCDMPLVEESLFSFFDAYQNDIRRYQAVNLAVSHTSLAEVWRDIINERIGAEFGVKTLYKAGKGVYERAIASGYPAERVWGWHVIFDEGGVEWALAEDTLKFLSESEQFAESKFRFTFIPGIIYRLMSYSVVKKIKPSTSAVYKVKVDGVDLPPASGLFFKAECPAHAIAPRIMANMALNIMLITYREIGELEDWVIPLIDSAGAIRGVDEMLLEFRDKYDILPLSPVQIRQPDLSN